MFEQTVSEGDPGARLGRQAQDDAALRQRLLADPKGTVEKELGRLTAPDGGAAQHLYLVVPLTTGAGAERGPASHSLSDADLEECTPGYPPPCFDCIGQGCLD